jgi:hypothetical protein
MLYFRAIKIGVFVVHYDAMRQDWTGTSDADPSVLMDRDIDLFYNYLELINRVLIPRIFAIHQTSCRQQYAASKKIEAAARSRLPLPLKRASGAASRGLTAKLESAVPADAHWGARGGSLLGDVAETLFGDILPLFWNLEMALSLLSGIVYNIYIYLFVYLCDAFVVKLLVIISLVSLIMITSGGRPCHGGSAPASPGHDQGGVHVGDVGNDNCARRRATPTAEIIATRLLEALCECDAKELEDLEADPFR